MGLIGNLMENVAGAIGETGRMIRTELRENREMTDEKKEMIERITSDAENGDVNAMYTLATAFLDGKEIRYNPQMACYWWTKAANAGHVDSMYNLGILYDGQVSKMYYDEQQAAYWLNEASIRGDREAREFLNQNYKYSSIFKKWKRK